MLNLWLSRNRLSIAVFVFILIIKLSSAVEFGISPPELIFEAETQKVVCQNIIFFSSYENLSLILSDKWTLQEKQTKNLADYSVNSSKLGISIDYPKIISAQKENIIPICITADKSGLYQGILIFEAEQSLMLGTWINLNVLANNEKTNLETLRAQITGFISRDSIKATNYYGLILESFFLIIVFICLKVILKQRRQSVFNSSY